jgi:hypothetical protein
MQNRPQQIKNHKKRCNSNKPKNLTSLGITIIIVLLNALAPFIALIGCGCISLLIPVRTLF